MGLPSLLSSERQGSLFLQSSTAGNHISLRRHKFARLQAYCQASNNLNNSTDNAPRTPATNASPSQPPPAGGALTARRTLLQGLCVGSYYALASRGVAAASPTLTFSTTDSLQRQLENRVHEFTLENGMRFLISQRSKAPIVSCQTYADVGAFDEPDGLTGIAHLLEHMAFKGTPRIGTTNYFKEAPLLDAMDEVFYSMLEAGSGREVARLQSHMDALQVEAQALAVPNEYGSVLQRAGAVGLNAATGHDSTKYYCNLPANKLELWFALESERFQVNNGAFSSGPVLCYV